jgi:hypothetical protein
MRQNKFKKDTESNTYSYSTEVSIGIKNLYRLKLLSKCSYTRNYSLLLFLSGVSYTLANVFHLPGVYDLTNGQYSGSITLNISTIFYLVACLLDYSYVKKQVESYPYAYDLNLTDYEKEKLNREDKINVDFIKPGITGIEVNYLLNVIGASIFLAGAFGFMPFYNYLYPGLYMANIGCFIILLSQVWRVLRFLKESNNEETMSNTKNVTMVNKVGVDSDNENYEKKFKTNLQVYNKYLGKNESLTSFFLFEVMMLIFAILYQVSTYFMLFGTWDDMLNIMIGYLLGSFMIVSGSIVLLFKYFFNNPVNNAIFNDKLFEKLI